MVKRNDPDELLTTSKVAEIIGVSRQYVTQLCQRGQLACTKIGRDFLVRRADAEAFRPAPKGRPPKKPRA